MIDTLGLYRLKQIEFSISERHLSLAGHFPGNPVVPAVVLLNETLSGVTYVYPNVRIKGFKRVKFLKAVLPGGMIQVRLNPTETGIGFQAYKDENRVFGGELTLEVEGR